ncbi:WD domain, G-beta repeat-containing protein [Besnoitia besnoiti]|uniref:Target of rapamycin complex subunit LST8 n=1 Tax=Besnoitia besnoiti TaxID=94643 RepID=A0A2A9MG74_BESBE|nr:WD domain, G-beta repeat-containing protein [Besnoitia besnoiti]PFH34653.1 WD domain, G-beta repeat-containing protein [Besnoitia besnoiti]
MTTPQPSSAVPWPCRLPYPPPPWQVTLPYPVLVAGGLDTCLFVWNAVTGACVATLKLADEQVNALAASQLVPSAPSPSRSCESEADLGASSTSSASDQARHAAPLLAADPDSRWPAQNDPVLVAAAGNPSITVFDIGTLAERSDDVPPCARLQGHEGNVRGVIFLPEPSQRAPYQDPSNGYVSASGTSEGEAGATGASSILCSCGDDATCRIWDLRAPRHQMLLQNEPGVAVNAVLGVSLSAVPHQVVTADANGTLRAWDLRSDTSWELARPARPQGITIAAANALDSEIAAITKYGSLTTFSLTSSLSQTVDLSFRSQFFPHGPNYVLSCHYSPGLHPVPPRVESAPLSAGTARMRREAQEELGAKRKQEQYAHAWWQQQKYAHEWWRKRGGGVWWQHLVDERNEALWGEKDRESAWADQVRWGGEWWQEFRGAKPWWQQEAGGRAWWQQRGSKSWWQRPHLEHAGDWRQQRFQTGGWYVWGVSADGRGRVETLVGGEEPPPPANQGDKCTHLGEMDERRDGDDAGRRRCRSSDSRHSPLDENRSTWEDELSHFAKQEGSTEEDRTPASSGERRQTSPSPRDAPEGDLEENEPEGQWVQRMATTGADGICIIWRREGAGEWTSERELIGHERWVWDCTFSRDGKMLVTASSDASCKLWSVETGKECLEYVPEKGVGAAGAKLRSTKAILAVSLLDAPAENFA